MSWSIRPKRSFYNVCALEDSPDGRSLAHKAWARCYTAADFEALMTASFSFEGVADMNNMELDAACLSRWGTRECLCATGLGKGASRTCQLRAGTQIPARRMRGVVHT